MNGAPRIALFIDGANLYATSKQLGFDMDYRRLLREFQGRGNLIRAFYFTTLVESEEYSSIRPLVDWLDYNGYRVITKAAKEFTDATGRRRVKGNMDIELAIEMLELALISTRSTCSRATAISVRWWKLYSARASRSRSSRRSRPTRRWFRTSCAGNATSSSTSPS